MSKDAHYTMRFDESRRSVTVTDIHVCFQGEDDGESVSIAIDEFRAMIAFVEKYLPTPASEPKETR